MDGDADPTEPSDTEIFRQPTRRELVGLVVVLVAVGVFFLRGEGAGWFTLTLAYSSLGVAAIAALALVVTTLETWYLSGGSSRSTEDD